MTWHRAPGIILQKLLPWAQRQPPAPGVAALDAHAEQAVLATEVLRHAARLLTETPSSRGSAEQQVQGFCEALVGASGHLRLAWVWFGSPQAKRIVPSIVAGPAAPLVQGLVIERSWLTRVGPAYGALHGRPATPFNVSEASLYPPWRQAAARHAVRAALALPLASALDERRGVFVLYADVPDYFDTVGVGLFEGIAELISSVLSQTTRQQQLEQAARTDTLTGLSNRSHAGAVVDALRAQPALLPLSLLLADVDHFKAVNDRHGHAAGDRVLVSVAARLRGGLRRLDGVARWGGEEFLLWLPATPQVAALAVAEKLRRAVADQPHDLGPSQPPLRATVSIGVAEMRPGEPMDAALARADQALYAAKRHGRNRVQAIDLAPLDPAAWPMAEVAEGAD